MDPTTVQLTFARGDASADKLQGVLDDELKSLKLGTPDPDDDRVAISDIRIVVDESGQGMDPISTSIVVGITAKLTADAIEALWTAKLWPAIVKKLGLNAVGEPRDKSSSEDRTK